MSKTVTYTHKGWFGICPVYLAEIDSEAPYADPRHWSMEWLMTLSDAVFGVLFAIRSAINPLYEPAWPLYVSGKLDKPIIRR